ncbi:hypothetical protein PFICI_11469 [Pestalotiopsis fici W106-1]|uniref:N-acetylgalactosaminide beta-1,3-galactosyltransferase n=1 Tax=Pestalotiopsis fici (strain W106-1 / CGMCC3.15140) TaxID=1229662 RepID=W3WSD1_PESFW|nr:uncharacterized protein PFICI_11469 [Pestalotiopsis fici W106-1]ETS76082.1 hypothetical protein PFICI_11469 [Pestalotiopsis fici W106-1]
MLGQKGMRRRGFRLMIVSFILTISFMLYLNKFQYSIASFSSSSIIAHGPSPICPKLFMSDNVAVVLRTGATESQEKLPVHFDTVMSCVSDFIVYSDYNETIQGCQTHDVLSDVDDTIKDTATEFALYKHLHTHGREGLSYKTMYGSGPSGAEENAGWKLDKWKFLPMVDRALQDRPNATWFVFIEGDTYMLWQNMLAYLAKFDAAEPHYLGKHMYINNILFGHGGSGFVLSRRAAEKVSHHWRQHLNEYNQLTQKEWAGDAILGKALKDAGVDMFWAFPHLQGDSLTTIDWNVTKLEREPWCYAPTTFHHMNEAEFRQLWHFERQWLAKWGPGGGPAPRFRDIFKGLVLPKLRPEIKDWDNLSSGREYSDAVLANWSDEQKTSLHQSEREAHFSFQHCRSACESKPTCLQFSFNNGVCFTSDELKLGHAVDSSCLEYSNAAGKCTKSSKAKVDATAPGKAGIASGWIMSRVAKYVSDLDQSCQNKGEKDWVI